MNLLQAQALCKTYGTGETAVQALKDVSFSVPKGEFVAVVGESGSGKSTLLNLLGGLDTPTSGKVLLDGRDLFAMKARERTIFRRRNIGFVFQAFNLIPELTVEQNILCALKKEKDPAARRAACAEALRAMRLEELAKRLPGALSGGQQQRAALARILAAKPRILMLDEPFSALDSYLREEVEGEVGSLLAGFAGTALLVTHNRDEAYRLCREMIVMDSGEVLRAGTTKEVFADPRTRAAARLTGCKNILPCTRVGEHTVRLAGWEQPLTVALPVPEGCRAVGIRAHDFAPCAPGTPNSLPVQAVSTSENPFDWNMIFTLPGGETRLWWKVSKETLAAPPPKAPACLAAAPENIMPLV